MTDEDLQKEIERAVQLPWEEARQIFMAMLRDPQLSGRMALNKMLRTWATENFPRNRDASIAESNAERDAAIKNAHQEWVDARAEVPRKYPIINFK